MKLNKDNADRVEENIRPPMALAITLPVEDRPDLAVYVALSPFQSIEKPKDAAKTLKLIAEHLDFDEAAIAKGRKLERESLIKRLRATGKEYTDAAVGKLVILTVLAEWFAKQMEDIANLLEGEDEKTVDSDNPIPT